MNRWFQIALLSGLVIFSSGCNGAKEKPIWEQVKIGEIAAKRGEKEPGIRPLKTINFNVHIFEMPAENAGKLRDIRRALYTRPLIFNNHDIFKANLFSVRFGQVKEWDKIRDLLVAAGCERILKVTLLLSDGQPNDLIITGFDDKRTITYIANDGTKDEAEIGPGVIVLRIRADKITGSRGVCKVVAHPVFTQPRMPAEPQLADKVKAREVGFTSAAFGLKMSPNDFVLLSPEKYISDLTILPGLFFTTPQGTVFFDESKPKPPERKPSVRVFLIVCTGLNY